MKIVLRSVWGRFKLNVVVGLVGIDLLAIFVYLGNRRNLLHPAALYLALYALAFCFYLYAGRTVQRRADRGDRALLWLIVLFAIAFRCAVLRAAPSLSTDIYRYVWDGRLICHGINPYRWSPWDPRLSQFRDPVIWAPMEYKAYQTVYMPVSQVFFAIGNFLFGNRLVGYKALFTLCDIGIIAAVMAILRRLGKDPSRAIWYAWCPLPVVEVSLAGHQDVTGVLILLLAIYLGLAGRLRPAAAALAAAGLTKGFALLLLPLFTRTYGRRLIPVMLVSMLYLGMPLWVYLPDFLHGMQQYLGYVHVNSGLFSAIDRLLSLFTTKHFAIASKLSDAAILAAVAWSIWTKPKTGEETIGRAIVVMAVCLLVVPTLFPWYILWLLPLVCVYGRAPSAAFLCLAGLVNMVYVYYLDREVLWWVPIVEYTPVYLLLIQELRSGYWRPAALPASDAGSGGVGDSDSVGDSASEEPAVRDPGTDATW